MELKNYVAESELYDVYESDGMAVRVYKKPEYKEKCLYAALTHARVETTLNQSSGVVHSLLKKKPVCLSPSYRLK